MFHPHAHDSAVEPIPRGLRQALPLHVPSGYWLPVKCPPQSQLALTPRQTLAASGKTDAPSCPTFLQQRLKSNAQVLSWNHICCPGRRNDLSATGTLTTVPLIFHDFYRSFYQSGYLLMLHADRFNLELFSPTIRTLLRTQDFVSVYSAKHECGSFQDAPVDLQASEVPSSVVSVEALGFSDFFSRSVDGGFEEVWLSVFCCALSRCISCLNCSISCLNCSITRCCCTMMLTSSSEGNWLRVSKSNEGGNGVLLM